MENKEFLIKSEMISQKKKIRLIWITAALFVAITVVCFLVEYSGYKKGQEFGLASQIVVSEASGGGFINPNDSYEEQCYDAYSELSSITYDMTIGGVRYDASRIRELEQARRETFAELMESGGYDRYDSYDIANWFKYTSIMEYFTEYYYETVLPICCYVFLCISFIFTLIVYLQAKRELVVYEDSVLCKVNSKKTKQLLFEDVTNVDVIKNTLKIKGTGFKYAISNVSNAEEIRDVIIEKKKAAQSKSNLSPASGADELKKYKELLDSGVISQEEFDTKKKQLLDL